MKIAKAIIFSAVFIVFTFVLSATVYARGAINIFPQSTQSWLNGGARLTENKAADTPLNNPAGAASMDDGFHLHLSGFYIFDKASLKNVNSGKEYDREVQGIMPYFAGTYKKDNWAAFLTFSVPGGNANGVMGDGGYPLFDYMAQALSGQLSTQVNAVNQSMEFGGGTAAVTLGGAYKVTDKLSIGGGIKYAIFESYAKGSADYFIAATGQKIQTLNIDNSSEGSGIGYVLSLNYAITPKFNLGFRYDSEISINAKTHLGASDNSGVVDGSEAHQDLPASVAMGARYYITEKTAVNGLFAYYLQEGISAGSLETKKWNNGYDIALSVNHQITENFNLICSIQYGNTGWTENTYTVANALNTSQDILAIALGSEYKFKNNFKFIGGVGTYSSLTKDNTVDPMGNYERHLDRGYVVTTGIEYSW